MLEKLKIKYVLKKYICTTELYGLWENGGFNATTLNSIYNIKLSMREDFAVLG